VTGAAVFAIYRIPLSLLFLPSGILIALSWPMEKVLIRHTPSSDPDKWYIALASGNMEMSPESENTHPS
jgi:hypothetical protein